MSICRPLKTWLDFATDMNGIEWSQWSDFQRWTPDSSTMRFSKFYFEEGFNSNLNFLFFFAPNQTFNISKSSLPSL